MNSKIQRIYWWLPEVWNREGGGQEVTKCKLQVWFCSREIATSKQKQEDITCLIPDSLLLMQGKFCVCVCVCVCVHITINRSLNGLKFPGCFWSCHHSFTFSSHSCPPATVPLSRDGQSWPLPMHNCGERLSLCGYKWYQTHRQAPDFFYYVLEGLTCSVLKASSVILKTT